jgi:hypothetical protein
MENSGAPAFPKLWMVPCKSFRRANPMSQSGWYHDRAAECDRLALASTNAVTRGRHIKDRDNWREIAVSIDAAEDAVKKRKEKEKE